MAVKNRVLDRLVKYVRFDTQSSETSSTFPSTEKQKILAKELVSELIDMGLKDAAMDEWGYVTATLPANVDEKVPVIGLIAHLDTSPDVSGKDVKPMVHENYQGGDIRLSPESGVVILADENPQLAKQIGHDIVTSDGTTLLGADNKAGIAEIFGALDYFLENPDVPHGTIKVAVMPDEEIGMGSDKFDIEKYGADYAYTIDGETVGEIENETFCADSVTLTVLGVNVHPGYAKNKLVNSVKIISEIISRLPADKMSPETTEKREGYVHPISFNGDVEKSVAKFLIRDFTVDGLHEKEEYLKKLTETVIAKSPKASFEFKVDEYYRNMGYQLDKDRKVVDYALEATKRAGLEPVLGFIRGGTDGAQLSFKGLLTPNVFTGGHNFHSRQEWVSLQDMLKTVDTIVELVKVWYEKK